MDHPSFSVAPKSVRAATTDITIAGEFSLQFQ